MGVKESMVDSVCFLFKFGELENLKKLQEGHIYCKNLKWYSDQEKNTGNKAMGDKLEGKHKMTQCKLKFISNETNEVAFEFNNVSVLLSSDNLEKMPVFCMTGITTKDLEFKEKDENTLVAYVKFSDMISKVYDEAYWNSVLVIENSTQFIERLTKACEDKRILMTRKPVSYTNMDINYTDRMSSIAESSTNIAFWKDNLYSYQHEYRFAFKSEVVDDSFSIDIGDISDISRIYNKKELIEFMSHEYRVEISSIEVLV